MVQTMKTMGCATIQATTTSQREIPMHDWPTSFDSRRSIASTNPYLNRFLHGSAATSRQRLAGDNTEQTHQQRISRRTANDIRKKNVIAQRSLIAVSTEFRMHMAPKQL
jgi:hypothetical protein